MNNEIDPQYIWIENRNAPRIYITTASMGFSTADEVVIQLGQYKLRSGLPTEIDEVGRIFMTRRMFRNFIVACTRNYNRYIKGLKK